METLENRIQKRIHVSLYALIFLTVLLGLSVLLEGCSDRCEQTYEYVYYEPVYTSLSSIRSNVELQGPKPVGTVGKIYFKDKLLFVNEPGEGIHIIDDADPRNPKPLKFLQIPGNYDIAIKGNTLYADSYIDLVVFDVSDVNNITEIKRLEGTFNTYNSLGYYGALAGHVVTDLVENKNVTVSESDCDATVQTWGGFFFMEGIAMPAAMASTFDTRAAITPGKGSGPGVGGSLARFTISGDYLYMLDGGEVQSVDVGTENNPALAARTYVSWDIETIFPYTDKLFLGARSGMYILDIASTPELPSLVSVYRHVNSCDPVVVNDHYAYVTLRSGNPTCDGFSNQLEVIDITNLAAPQLVKMYPMHNPHGLGIDNQTLFVCDGDAGLKVFDASDKLEIASHQLAHYKNIHAYDVIPFNKVLMMIGEDGIFQYDYSDAKSITLLSHIPVTGDDE